MAHFIPNIYKQNFVVVIFCYFIVIDDVLFSLNSAHSQIVKQYGSKWIGVSDGMTRAMCHNKVHTVKTVVNQ